ncbi:MAG: radical SAM protein [Candidatus Pacearchaeota archaeon]
MTNEYDRFNSWKVLVYADRICRILKGEFPPPVVMHIYPSNKCNLNCEWCIMAEEKAKYPVMLKKETLFKAFKDASENDIKLIHLSGGGEPLLHPNIYEVLEYNKNLEKRVKVAISTGGVLLKPELANYVDHIRVSLDAGSEEIHQKVKNTNKKLFNKICKNIEDLVNYRNKNNLQCDIGLGFVISPDNWTDIYNFCKVGNDLKVDFLHIRPAYYPKTNPKNELLKMITPSVLALVEKAKNDFKNIQIFSITEKFDGYWTPRIYDKCRATPLQAVLTATGEFVVCQDVFIRFGDYNKQSFWEIWDSKEHKLAIEKIDLEKCPRCVENKHNEIIQEMFIKNKARLELI